MESGSASDRLGLHFLSALWDLFAPSPDDVRRDVVV